MQPIKTSKIRRVSFSALSIALVFVATSSISVYIPATRGYFNLGDSMIFLTAILFGPIVGGMAGGFGSMLSDIFLGYTVFAPATLVVKGIEGFITGKLYRLLMGKETGKTWLVMMFLFVPILILGVVVTALMFTGEEAEISLFSINPMILPSQTLLFTILVVLAALIMVVLRFHKKNIPIIISCFIGGFEMVLGYFVYEVFLVGLGAIFEIPANFAQMFLGAMIANTIYVAIEKKTPKT
ncbi:MAG: ECF transporter S component [Candidatus Brockarchaeota archaeon]|nr:ECF transporter S component [Candidatus Brockarchaeota archaeon]